jgi:tetratricopeptide (TPR) repeat protein
MKNIRGAEMRGFTGSTGERVLAQAQSGREVIQQYVALPDSLEWNLGQEYLRQRGNKAFLADSSPVPFVVNNDGSLSRNAAEVFFASLLAADAEGTLEDEIAVLELGIGVGLFARYFLDAMRELSRQHRKDYYERLTYIAADRSRRMLDDVLRHGVLAGHPGRVRVRQVDAMQPETLLRDVAFAARAQESGVRGQEEATSGTPRSGIRRNSAFAQLVTRAIGRGEGGIPANSATTTASEDGILANSATRRAADVGGVGYGPIRAVFLNYLLDCLPAAVLRFEGESVKQLCVRTCVARNVRLADYTDLTAEQLRERAKSDDPRARDELLEVYGLFASEYDYQPVDPRTLPYADFALDVGQRLTRRFLHSYGAIACLEKLLAMLTPGGFILVNDYGQTLMDRDDEFEHQRFSLATFVGVNFSLLRQYFGVGKRCEYLEPDGEEGLGIHARLLARGQESGDRSQDSAERVQESRVRSQELGAGRGGLLPEVRGKFTECFGEARYKQQQEPIQKARACGKAGRFEMAAGFYREALALQPRNWVLLAEVSQFLTFSLRDPKAGADMAKVALGLNPTCSAELWNALGDALYEFGRTEEARSAYAKALAVNSADVRARYNLAWVHQRLGDYPAALGRLAEALALDRTGEYRERLLAKQQEVLARLTARHQQEFLLLINLVSRNGNTGDEKPNR